MELSSSEKIEKLFEKYFQKTIELYINGQLYKKGKFLLIDNKIIHHNFFFEFAIEKTKKIDIIKIPYPFKMEEHDDGVLYFDYRLRNLLDSSQKSKVINILKSIGTEPSKLFDGILEIKFL